jgi:hypothetical protein
MNNLDPRKVAITLLCLIAAVVVLFVLRLT